MRLFISWSGTSGKAIAEVLSRWLPNVIQAVKPFFSADDIAMGARWSDEVGSELESAHVGIVVVTREACAAPWVMFEAGALSKGVGRTRVVPILFDAERSDLSEPLTQFQCAQFDATDIKRVLRMINSELGDLSLTDDVLESGFEKWWPDLRRQVAHAIAGRPRRLPETDRSDRAVLDEILALTRSLSTHRPSGQRTALPRTTADSGAGALSRDLAEERMRKGGNLSGANLMDLDLSRMDLSGANLRGANLVGAVLTETKLVNADLSGANLERANLSLADLDGADISRTNLWHATMTGVVNLDSVASMDQANFFQVETERAVRDVIAAHETISIGDYPGFFAHFRGVGMTRAEMRDLFLWAAHSYPGEAL